MSITLIIIIVTGLISYKAFNDQNTFHTLKHYPVAEYQNKEWYRMLSSGFVHGSWLHLLINLYVLYIFGTQVESIYLGLFGELKGRLLYLVMYLLTIVIADLPTYFKHKNNPHYAAIGASGAVSGVAFNFILFYPWSTLYFYGIVPFPAIIGGVAYLAYSSWASKKSRDNIDHSAHFYGAIFGVLFTIALQPKVITIFIDQFMAKF